jgi:uncharacterized protein YggE
MRPVPSAFAAALFLVVITAPALAQFGGSRAGLEGGGMSSPLPLLEPEVARGYITVDGVAEIRVEPTELRVVLAVTGEGDAVDTTIARVRDAWTKRNIAAGQVHEDFIAVLPRYEWVIEKRGDVEVGLETLVGYRMQSNLHLVVPTEAVARRALDDAFAAGVTDVIAFDYGSREIDAARTRARSAAVRAAREKADLLLAVFEDRPPVVNVQERTEVHEPASLYHSFEIAHDEQVTPPYRRDIPFVRAAHPRNTYYRGLTTNADVAPRELPMRPQISVVSRVRLYYSSPGATAVDAKPFVR